jgi:hypothetical protein
MPGLQETKEFPAYNDLFGSDYMIHNYLIIRGITKNINTNLDVNFVLSLAPTDKSWENALNYCVNLYFQSLMHSHPAIKDCWPYERVLLNKLRNSHETPSHVFVLFICFP